MKRSAKRYLSAGLLLVLSFVVFTYLVQTVDVKGVGVDGTNVGFSALNMRFHSFFGVDMALYVITDWAGLVPVFAAFSFAVVGLVQWILRKNILKVDVDILALGVYYIVVATLYVVFEIIPINYRPVRINGFLEASYPSSTTLLVLSVMPTWMEQISRRCKKNTWKNTAVIFGTLFSVFTVLGRLVCGVHWLTDVVGSVLISAGLFCLYRSFVSQFAKKL